MLGCVATGFALVAALLNAVFGFCLGCEMYLLSAVRTRLADPEPAVQTRQTIDPKTRKR